LRILVFSLFSEIWEHSLPENLITRALGKQVALVDYLFCGGTLKGLCHCMEARKLKITSADYQKESICNTCRNIAHSYSKPPISQSFFITQYLSSRDEGSIDQIMQNMQPDDCINFTYQNINVGRIAFYEMVLKFKKNTLIPESEEEFSYLLNQIRNCLYIIHAGLNFLKDKTYDQALIYSPQYAVNHTFSQILVNQNIETYFLEAGVNISNRLDTMRIWKWNTFKLVNPLISCWPEMKKLEIYPDEIKKVTRHFLDLLKANSHMVFSPRFSSHKNLRELYQIPPHQKLLLATMSSSDEVYSAYLAGLFPSSKACSDIFKDQIEWIKYLIDFVNLREDVFLIIRVHPRDFPNKRDSSVSYQGKKLLEIFGQGGNKYQINWPDQNISLYEMFDEVNVLLTGWSVTALEAAILGIPVVTYDQNLPSYPVDLMLTGRSVEEYANNISRALQKDWSFDQIVSAYHWLAVNHCILSLPISINFTQLINQSGNIIFRIIFKIFRFFKIDLRFKYYLFNIKQHDAVMDGISNVITKSLPSSAHSDYFSKRNTFNPDQFKKIVKNEFKSLTSIYFRNYNKHVSYETLNTKINRFFNEKEKNCISDRN